MMTQEDIDNIPDEKLGQYTKYALTQWLKDHDLSKTDPGTATHFYAGLIWFGWLMKDAGSTEFIANVKGLTYKDVEQGDFEVIIRKADYEPIEITLWDKIVSPFRQFVGKKPRQFKFWY